MPKSPSRRDRQALWLVPLLLLLVLTEGLLPRAHHHGRRPSGQQTGQRAALHSEAVADTARISARPRASVPLISVSLVPQARLRSLPNSFLGLSTETWAVPGLESDPVATARVLNLLRIPGDGSLMLRLGGQSTEQTYWRAPNLGVGTEAYRPGRDWLKMLRSLTSASRLHLLIDLNLVARSPSMAASFAKALAQAMPRGSLSGFEVGNEPDIGHRQVRNPLAPAGEPVPSTPRGWDQYTSSQYISLFRAYANAVHRVVPSVRMAGPEVFFAGRDAFWIQQLVAAQRSRLGMLTVHRYPLSACTTPTAGDRATIPRLLGQNASGGLANELVDAVRIANRSRLPMRLSEFNSVTCGGAPGVSDAFATALWAPDTLFSIWNVGAAGVNLHLAPTQPNAAFSISASGLTAHPLLYGMIMFARAMGPGAGLAPVSTPGALSHGVKVWAVHSAHNVLKLLVLDKGAGAVNTAMHLGNHGPATIQRLLAPGPTATSGVTLAGQQLSPQGQWLGRRVTAQISPVNGTYTVPLPAYSGALITVHL
ncbi:MAG TPA: glycosyl hydrolase family 79 C-terminal domain-containing protein [Solirubrobacteraceae bacterium]|nr:glycosyl hydrolase family 79 C-terminal domain-containing protein [Solirubrobacteraceae bacterium]